MKNKDIYLILHNIRSVHNVGAIFRTAECAGIKKIYLIGITPAPTDRFGRARVDFHKSALGAETLVEWEYKKNCSGILQNFRIEGVEIIAVEQARGAVDYKKIKIKKTTAFIFGNEVKGIPDSILKKANKIAEIPLRGKKESLNVSTSVGIFLFRVLQI